MLYRQQNDFFQFRYGNSTQTITMKSSRWRWIGKKFSSPVWRQLKVFPCPIGAVISKSPFKVNKESIGVDCDENGSNWYAAVCLILVVDYSVRSTINDRHSFIRIRIVRPIWNWSTLSLLGRLWWVTTVMISCIHVIEIDDVFDSGKVFVWECTWWFVSSTSPS